MIPIDKSPRAAAYSAREKIKKRFDNLALSSHSETLPESARLEDSRLLTGHGRFVADETEANEAHAAFVRSPYAHALIHTIDTMDAENMPGVIAILTGSDLKVSGFGGIPWDVPPPGIPDDTPMGATEIAEPQPLIADSRVLYVGQIVAMIIADTINHARDAAETVAIEWQALSTVITLEQAVAKGATPLWPEQSPGNVCFTMRKGDPEATKTAIRAATHTVSLHLRNNRLTANPIEPRTYLGRYDEKTRRYTLRTQAGAPHMVKRILTGNVLHIDADKLRVIVRDVGGGFGMKNAVFPEEALVLIAAKHVGSPVRWQGERGECLLTDVAARDQVCTITLALDAEGQFTGLKVRTLANLGSYLAGRGVISPANAAKVVSGCYRIPAVDLEVRGIYTNTMPTAPYRGAGQPEQIYFLERIIDAAARQTGIDRAALRRRNMLRPNDLPYNTPCGIRYEEGDFSFALDAAIKRAEWTSFAARQEEALENGQWRGIGVAMSFEAKAMDRPENAIIRIGSDGRAEVIVGTISSGQGHETAYARLISKKLAIPVDAITVIQGDTDLVAQGGGTAASRSILIGGSAIAIASDVLIEKARMLAAEALEAAVTDLEFVEGTFQIRGTDRHITLAALSVENQLFGDAEFMPENFSFPYGCHIAEVTVDPQTGKTHLERYIIVQDVGTVLNHTIIDGQLHGGLAQGIGQAVLEEMAIDPDTGQVLSGSFMDYAMPRADDIGDFDVILTTSPAHGNPLGVRPVGETGPTGAPPAVINAILDALAPAGVSHIDMPATPQAVWRAIQEAGNI